MSMSTGVEEATGRAIAFLSESQLPTGEIPIVTVPTPDMVGEATLDPCIFPAPIVALALADVPGTDGIRALIADFLEAEMDPEGVWRFSAQRHPRRAELPADVDDTALTCAALAQEGRPFPDPTPLLRGNRDGRGLYYTWFAPRLAWRGRPHAGVAWRTWLTHPLAVSLFFNATPAQRRDIDAVINANVLYFLPPSAEDAPVVRLLLDVLRGGDEARCDKWYDRRFLVWYCFARALRPRCPEALDIIAAKLAVARPDAALDLALAITTAVRCGRPPQEESIEALLCEQRADGSWPRASVFHHGRPRRRDGSFGPGHPQTLHWGSAEMTTAFCLEALWAWKCTRR
jgi:hypothetical protein